MRRHTPADGQMILPRIDPTERMRSVRLVDLRSVEMYRCARPGRDDLVRYGCAAHKHLLLLLDHHIGGRDSWAMGYDEIAAEMGITESSARRLMAELDRAALIVRSADLLGVRVRIVWTNILPYCRTSTTDDRTGTTDDRTDTTDDRTDTTDDRTDTTALYTTPSTPPPSPPPDDSVVVMVREAGVSRAVEIVREARSVGMTDPQMAAVVDHWRAHPGRWAIGILADRLRRSDAAAMPADQGWYGDAPGWRPPPQPTAAIDLETIAGATLDAMSDDDLLPQLRPRTRDSVRRLGRSHPDVRRELLTAVAQRQEQRA